MVAIVTYRVDALSQANLELRSRLGYRMVKNMATSVVLLLQNTLNLLQSTKYGTYTNQTAMNWGHPCFRGIRRNEQVNQCCIDHTLGLFILVP